MDPLCPGSFVRLGNFHGILGIDGNISIIALVKTHTFTVEYINSWYYYQKKFSIYRLDLKKDNV
jgi:hypothetical protein